MNHHELIIKLSTVIRCSYSSLPGIHPLQLSPEMSEIYGTMDEEKLQIHNEVYKCPGLRKIHLETAKLGSLDVLHCVYFPDSNYDFPIIGADLVATPRGVGDLLVTVEVEIPTQVSDKELLLIEELADVMSKKTPKD